MSLEEYDLAKKLVSLENDIRKLKTRQVYGNSEVVGYDSNEVVFSANYFTRSLPYVPSHRVYWWGGILKFVSELPDRVVIGRLYEPKYNGYSNPTVFRYFGDKPNEVYFFVLFEYNAPSGFDKNIPLSYRFVGNCKGVLSMEKIGVREDFPEWLY